MLKLLAIVAGVLFVCVAGVMVYAATKPDTFRLARSTSIDAPPEAVFPLINDFRNWREWSPYENLDPRLERNYEGPTEGLGAVYAWTGNKQVGQGRMEIVESNLPDKVRIKLDFFRPFEAHNIAEFDLHNDDGATKVTWAMTGPQPFLAKLMSVFVDFDSMVGKDFEVGLENLKAVAEKS